MLQVVEVFFVCLKTIVDSNMNISECTSLKSTWNDVESDKQFPVTAGAVLTLSCKEQGYGIVGSELVTCKLGKEFSFDEEPGCLSEYSTH